MGRVSETITTFLPWSEIEPEAQKQILNTAELPFVFKWVAVMPDCHYGKGATVGSVIATKGAIVPAAVGVDIGCGMVAMKLSLTAEQLPDNLTELRSLIEARIPVGPKSHNELSRQAERIWYNQLKKRFDVIQEKHPGFSPKKSPGLQLGTL